MLGRHANGIFWMFRYLERAENTARLIDAGQQIALTNGADAADDEWRSVLVTTGQNDDYLQSHDDYSAVQVPNYMLRAKGNPNCILSMIENARTNAREVRTSLTREVWETTNETWITLKEALSKPVKERNLGDVLTQTRQQSALVRGAMEGTMLRNEIYNFATLGTYVERADHVARLLDVKYYLLLPNLSMVGSDLDNRQWEALLRSLSGIRAYRWLNAGRMDARGITNFLLLDRRFPRSLRFCIDKLESNLRRLGDDYDEETLSLKMAASLAAELRESDVEQVFEAGLHQVISLTKTRAAQISDAISADYRFVE